MNEKEKVDNLQENIAWLKRERDAEVIKCPHPLTHLVCERNADGGRDAMPCSTEFLETPPEEFKARFEDLADEVSNLED